MHAIVRIPVLVVFASLALIGCGDQPISERGSTIPTLAAKEVPGLPPPGDFVRDITNPYLAFAPGKKFYYESETPEGLETNVVEITRDTKVILGVTTTVVRDQVYLNGDLAEDTFDWYAQDKDGNVWYFGEDTKELVNGQVVSTHGSWEAGKEGPPGIIMLANPQIGLQYKQEDAKDIAEDMGKVVSLSEAVAVDYGSFANCLKTAEWSLVESGPRDYKFYAPGVGMVLEILSRGKRNEMRVELTDIDGPGHP
jgi:hypothetical protein